MTSMHSPVVRRYVAAGKLLGVVAVGLLLMLAALSFDLSLAAQRAIFFSGLLVVELAAVYQAAAYRQRRH